MINNALEDVTVFKPESDEDEDEQSQHEEICDLNKL